MDEWERLDRRLRERAAADDVSGTALLTRGGEVVFHGCYGPADRAAGVPISERTRFGLASVTKMLTAVAVADQVRAGALALDDRVVDLLPPDQRPATLHPDVTPAHLLLHTSGIADYAEEDEASPGYLADYASLWRDRPSYRIERPLDVLPLFADRPAYRPPGRVWQYSNAGYILLGIVLEHLTGRAYVDLVRERVLDPAGMGDSGFLRLDEPEPDVAVGYLDPPRPGALRRTNVFSVPVVGLSDGGAFATALDLDRFLHRVADGSLMGDLTESMVRPRWVIDEQFSHGYGFLHHTGEGRWGHGGGDPGVACLVHRFPADDVHLIVLCNVVDWLVDLRTAVLDTWREVSRAGPPGAAGSGRSARPAGP